MTTELLAVERQHEADIRRWISRLKDIAEATGAKWSTSRSFANLVERLQSNQRHWREATQADEWPELPPQPRHQHEAKLRLTTEVREALINIGRLLDAWANARDARDVSDEKEYEACVREAQKSHRIVAGLMENIEQMAAFASFGASGGADFRYDIDNHELVALFEKHRASGLNQTDAVERMVARDGDRIGLAHSALVTRLQKLGVWQARKR